MQATVIVPLGRENVAMLSVDALEPSVSTGNQTDKYERAKLASEAWI
jgi:hypothetical protein